MSQPVFETSFNQIMNLPKATEAMAKKMRAHQRQPRDQKHYIRIITSHDQKRSCHCQAKKTSKTIKDEKMILVHNSDNIKLSRKIQEQ